MKWFVIGAGSIGKRHVRNIHHEFPADPIWVFDPNGSNLEALTEIPSVHAVKFQSDWEQIHPDIVIIASPNHLHIEQALYWIDRDAHLLIEKPLSHTLQGIETLLEKVRSKQKKVMVACNMRFFPNIVEVKRLLDAKAVGTIYGIQVESGSYFPNWRPNLDYRKNYGAIKDQGGGVVLDIIHEIDLLKWYGGPIQKISAYADRVSSLEIDTEDIASIICRFESGALGEAHLDYLQRAYSRSCKIIGEKGTITWDYEQRTTQIYLENSKKPEIVFELPATYDLNQMYLAELHHFCDAIHSETLMQNPLEEALETMKIAMAIKESAQQDRSVFIKDMR